jgi:two-component system chemotaxis response regulator CheY
MPLKVLIVDDALFMRNMLRRILEGEGCEIVAEATNGDEGVEQFRLHAPDIVTMDIIMPVKNGIEALKEILAVNAKACVIMCSALGQEALVAEASAAGARDFILKPFNEVRVREVIAKLAGA